MEFKDYYKTLGVARDADAASIKKAYRKLARKYHPDVSKEDAAEQRMAEINEAYAVLGDADKRKAYDEVGAQAWAQGARSGDDVRPPPGWQGHAGGQGARDFHYSGNEGDFSEFFEQMFGRRQASAGGQAQMRGRDRHARVELDLVDAYQGTERELTLRDLQLDASGQLVPGTRTLQVKIPKGVREGQLIRLAGHGEPGLGGGPAGDLLLEVQFRDDGRWQVDGADVTQRLRIAPWEAALGAQVRLHTPDGKAVEVAVPAGSGAGRKLRLKGRGIPARRPGDLYLALDIAVPGAITPEQKQAWQALGASYPSFDPRSAG